MIKLSAREAEVARAAASRSDPRGDRLARGMQYRCTAECQVGGPCWVREIQRADVGIEQPGGHALLDQMHPTEPD